MKEWRERWNRYQEWAETHAEPDRRSFSEILKDVDWLYSNFPEDVRRTDPDPEKLGIQNLYRIFALCEQKRQSRISPSGSD